MTAYGLLRLSFTPHELFDALRSCVPASIEAAAEFKRLQNTPVDRRTFGNIWFGAPDPLTLALKRLAQQALAARLPAGFSGRLGLAAGMSADGCVQLWSAASAEPHPVVDSAEQLPTADRLAGISPDDVFDQTASTIAFTDARGEVFTLLTLAQTLRAARPEKIARGGGAGLNLTFAHWNKALLAAAESPAVRTVDAVNRHPALSLIAVHEWWVGPSAAHDVKFDGMALSPRTTVKPLFERLLAGARMASDPRFTDPYWRALAPKIIDATEDFVVVEKPSGLLSVPGTLGLPDAMTLAAAAVGSALTPVHRLDMDTSGLVVYSRRESATKSLMAQFREGLVTKSYRARVAAPTHPERTWLEKSKRRGAEGRSLGVFTEDGRSGTVELPITTNPLDRLRQCAAIGGRASTTEWTLLAHDDGTALLKLTPVTGRTHQLRLHSAHPLGLGAPILGDPYYSPAGLLAESPATPLNLHAAELAFNDPTTGERRTYSAKAPF